MNLTLSPHARRQAAAKGIAIAAIQTVAANPGSTFGSFRKDDSGNRIVNRCQRCGTDQQKWTGNAGNVSLCLVVNPCCKVIVTLWVNGIETAIRDDQRAKGITAYKGANGEWTDGTTVRPTAPAKPKGKPLTAKQKKALKKARHARRNGGQA